MSPWKISPLCSDEIEAVRTMALVVPEFSVGTDTPSFYSTEALQAMCESSDVVAFVAKSDTRIVGFILTSLLVAARDAYIHTLAVDMAFRRMGIGSALIATTLQEIKKRQPSINHVFTDVQVENEVSVHAFTGHGFQKGSAFYYVDRMI